MTSQQHKDLRDQLFASKFATGEHVFRYLSVEPSDKNGAETTVHYAFAPAVWERAGCTVSPDEYVNNLIDATIYGDQDVSIEHHSYMGCGWPRPWTLTAKESHNDFPILVLHEQTNGHVAGVLMRESNCDRTLVNMADTFAEYDEVSEVIAELRALPHGSPWGGWFKDSNIDANSVVQAIETTPQTDGGQKQLAVYRDAEWLHGHWNDPTMESSTIFGKGLELLSIADFHGTRVSGTKLGSRAGLEQVRAAQTIAGNYADLERAISVAGLSTSEVHEENLAVKYLCHWWNESAPQDMRSAALFRAYIWDEENKTFIAGDPEEPATQADQFAKNVCFSLFEQDHKPTIALVFFRGRKFNTEGAGEVSTYSPNGERAWTIGLRLSQVDEAYYSVVGIRSVARHIALTGEM